MGCGRIGKRHAQLMAQFGILTAVCDVVPERAETFAAEFGAQPYYKAEEMFASLEADAVAICTPNGLHAPQSIAALNAGYHVLCEKPMAMHLADALAMQQAAAKAGKMLVVVKQNRFNPPVQVVKRLLEEGRLGQISSVQVNCFWNRSPQYYANSWKGTLALDGGTLFTQFSHFVDLLCWFLGPARPVAVSLQNALHQGIIEFEDTGQVLFKTASGIPGTLHYTVNAWGKNMEGSITIFGEKGTVKIGGEYLNELEYQQLEGGPVGNLPPGNPPNQYGHYTGSMSNHHLVYQAFSAALQGNGPAINGLQDAISTVSFIEEVYTLGRA